MIATRTIDTHYLLNALSHAAQARGQCAPNPAVGAVIVNSKNEIVASGYHTGPGKPHAEIEALKKISYQANGMTIYVTLEPCCHYGRTPPCTQALIKAGLKRVIYGYQDPNPIVSGKGASELMANNILCEYISLPEINDFYQSYRHWHTTKKPFITAKIAMTLDGKIAGPLGKRIQITGAALQELTHRYRKESDAILTTAKTINNDDPKLNARYQNKIIPKKLYVLDRHLTLSPQATIFKTAETVTLFHAKSVTPTDDETLNVRCIPIDEDEFGLDLQQIIQHIGNDGIHDLWIEAGGQCFTSFLKQKLVQRALIYIAPRWLGDGLAAFPNHFSLEDLDLSQAHWQQVGSDVVLTYHPAFVATPSV